MVRGSFLVGIVGAKVQSLGCSEHEIPVDTTIL